MRSGTWTLAGRMRVWFAAITIIGVLATTTSSAWFVWRSVDHELSALTEEEIDEMQALFGSSERTPEAFVRIATELDIQHSANALAWRAWRTDTREPWASCGDQALLRGIDLMNAPLGLTASPGDERRYRVEKLSPEIEMGVVLDGSAQIAILHTYALFALVFLAIATGISMLGGAVLGRRISALLSDVVEGVGAIEHPGATPKRRAPEPPEEIRQVSEALGEILDTIRRENERAKLMTAGLAHELRSPIQNMLGEAQVALLRERSAAEYREVLESQVDELRDLTTVVHNLVTLCSMADSSSTDGVETFDLGTECQLRFERERARALRKNVTVAITTAGELQVKGDREALLLALHNMVRNAVQWSPEGESIRVNIVGSSTEIDITVDDAGPGIAEDLRERAFEPFFSVSEENGHRAGYGMGLALAREAVAAQGGSIRAELSPHGGARLHVVFPRFPRREGSMDGVESDDSILSPGT